MWKARHVRQGIGGGEGSGRALELILNRVEALRWVVVVPWGVTPDARVRAPGVRGSHQECVWSITSSGIGSGSAESKPGV